MIAGADTKVHDAFCATLREQPSSVNLLVDYLDVGGASDVLEVTDLERAIARAEDALRARSSAQLPQFPESSPSLDLFDALVARSEAPSPEAHAPLPSVAPQRPEATEARPPARLVPSAPREERSRARAWAITGAIALCALSLVVAATSFAGAAGTPSPTGAAAHDEARLEPPAPAPRAENEAPKQSAHEAPVPVVDVRELKSAEPPSGS